MQLFSQLKLCIAKLPLDYFKQKCHRAAASWIKSSPGALEFEQ